ncbi:MAG: AbrB/MazE/SpoVT family DNA-binding domain-containing protein [Defluviitaleaceae bacterium]|nr:AbrB/MazE/SpoVT family DNA-binding domain-containing protein [Defluviitaleaceae bacterium]
MQNYKPNPIDGQGRIALHQELREKLNLEIGSIVKLLPEGNKIILQKADKKDEKSQQVIISTIDGLGRITMSMELTRKMGWKEKDEVSVYYIDNDMLILRLYNEPRAVGFGGLGLPPIIPR